MYIIKVLKRKDASSVVVAIWLALSLNQITTLPVFRLADLISGIGASNYSGMYGGGATGWRTEYFNPIVSFVLQIVVLEILIRLFTEKLMCGPSSQVNPSTISE